MSKINWKLILFVSVIFLGILLRTYHIQEWLRFGPDQARDASLIGDIIKNKSDLPLLGPQAGNTLFSLGPAYYYLEYFSAVIFGTKPEVFSYPIIFFSVLSITLFYFLLKEFFGNKISFILITLYSLSYFSVVNSRFASNSNLIPFFLFLFFLSILKILNKNNSQKIIWYISWGIALGIGIQLHTVLLVSLPLVSFLAFVYLVKKRLIKIREIFALVIFMLIVNWGQILFDLKNQGQNISAFFRGAEIQSGLKNNFFRDAKLVGACQLQANVQIIFPLEKREECEILNVGKNYRGNPNAKKEIKGPLYLIELILVLTFSLGGYLWLFKGLFEKKFSAKLRSFLGLTVIYNLITFLVFIPVAGEIGTRYFIVLNFIPFVLLGLWINKILSSSWNVRAKNIFVSSLILILLFYNCYFLLADAKKFKSGKASDDRISVLGEILPVADYMIKNSDSGKTVLLSGERISMNRFANSLIYLAGRSKVSVIKSQPGYDKKNNDFETYFYIALADDKNEKKLMEKVEGQEIVNYKKFGRIAIFILKNRNE